MKLLFAVFLHLFLGISAVEPQNDSGSIIFPGPIKRQVVSRNRNKFESTKLALVIKMAKELSQFEANNELNSGMNLPFGSIASMKTHSSFSQDISERSNVEISKPVPCKPELQVVPLIENPDSSYIYNPSCTRIKRCSGCCYHNYLTCEPTETVTRNFGVWKKAIENGSLIDVEKIIVSIDEHKKCKCQCKIKREHCTKYQTYIPELCKCECSNVDKEQKCEENPIKIWDPDQCSCVCKIYQSCNCNFEFDENTCSCRPDLYRKPWSIERISTSYIHNSTGKTAETPIIVPLDPNNARSKRKERTGY